VAGVSVASPAWYVPVGLLGGLATLASPWLFDGPRARWVGPLLGVLAVGYGLGAGLALLAGWLAGSRSTGSLRSVGLPFVHAGLVVLVLGVALSTYGASAWTFDQGDPLVRGEPAELGAHEIELVDGQLVDEDGDERPETLAATVHVSRDGTFLDEQRLALSYAPSTGFAGQGSFVPESSPAVRSWWGDLALNAETSTPLAIRVDEAGANATWVVANGPLPRELSGEVEAVSMGVQRLPGVNLVWAGVALTLAGFGLRVSGTRG
jgi:hypothetical protein